MELSLTLQAITHAMSLGYAVTLTPGIGHCFITLAKSGQPTSNFKSVTQVIPNHHYNDEYLKEVIDWMIKKDPEPGLFKDTDTIKT